jgi:NtrC-family two-component system sensor histidine kinase KinB
MKLRTKLLLAQLPLIVSLAVTAYVGSVMMAAMGRGSDRILRDNYRSVLAAQRMKAALVELDRGAMSTVAGRWAEGQEALRRNRQPFETELRAELDNITEEGEQHAADELATRWRLYVAALDNLPGREDPRLGAYYFDTLIPASGRVREAAEAILALNQDAMLRKSAEAQRLAARGNLLVITAALLGAVLGVIASGVLTSRLLRPLSVLSQAARRLGEGDLAVRARVRGEDEVAMTAAEFNVMAEHLQAYHESSLGELLQAQQAVQAAIDSMPDPVAVIALDGRVMNVNAAAGSLLALSPGDAVSRAEARCLPVVEHVRSHVLAGHGPYVPKSFDEAFRVGSGESERAFLPRGNPLYDDRGRVIGSTVVLQDVTRLLRLDELRRNVVATVAHEFRTPLTSLHMSIHLCLEEVVGPLTDKQAELLTAAREDCERLQTIVSDVLELSRAQVSDVTLRFEPVSSEALVAAALTAQKSALSTHSVQVRAEVGPDAGEVRADRERLSAVFANLLANAIRHSPASGTVTLVARATGNTVRFEIADEGEGIAPQYHSRIFDKYFQIPGTPHGGAGLGLSIARDIVQAHGGAIGVESVPGHGARFWFTVPTSASTRAST